MEVELACEILGVTRDATEEQIQSQFRHLTKQVHPDQGGSRGLLRLLVEARKTLDDDLSADSDTDPEFNYTQSSASPHYDRAHSQPRDRDHESAQTDDPPTGNSLSSSASSTVSHQRFVTVSQPESSGMGPNATTRAYQRFSGEFVDLSHHSPTQSSSQVPSEQSADRTRWERVHTALKDLLPVWKSVFVMGVCLICIFIALTLAF